MNGKENIKHVTCKSHTARSDKDIYRVSTSKLTMHELEDLYFSLVENNTQLKKTVNAQRDQIKILTTKVQRMTVQKPTLGCQNRECCVNTKAIIMEQKESIADLKEANERLSDRIHLLNMRLCSAKQFLRLSPAQSSSRCAKCCITSTTSIKNTSLTALNTRASEANLQADVASSMYVNKGSSTTEAVDIVPSDNEIKPTLDEPCQQNKCRSVIEELKEKIGTLEKELSTTHEKYSERICKLEEEILLVREENFRVRSNHAASEQRLVVRNKKAGVLLKKLRATEAQCDDLATQLQIEKSRVCELEMQVKASDISVQVAKALESHINTSVTVVRNNSETINSGIVPDKDVNKSSDDSGYTESKTQELETKKDIVNTEANVLDQIAILQAQLDNLKLSVEHNPNDMKTNGNSDHRQNSVVQNTYGVVDATSSLSNDIFQTSRVKDIDQIGSYPFTSRAPDVLISSEDIDKSPKTGVVGLQQTNKYNSHNMYPMTGSLPVDMPKYLGESGTSSKIISNKSDSIQTTNGFQNAELDKDNSYHSSLKNYINGTQSLLNEYKKIDNISNVDTNIENEKTKDELFNVLLKKRRRSSLKGSSQDKSNKDLSVIYDETKTIVGSTINFTNIRDSLSKKNSPELNDIGNVIHQSSQNESDPRVEFKINDRNVKNKIKYKKKGLDNASTEENETKCVDEKICGTNFGTEKNTKISTNTINQLDNHDNVRKKDASEDTYSIKAKPTKNASVEDVNDKIHLGKKNGLTAPLSPRPIETSTPKHQRTYNLAALADVIRTTSPDNTDNEISSMTDLPNETEDKSPQDYISPGEERATSTLTESYGATTTDYGSLSEGELPVTEAKKMTYSDIKMKDKTTDSIALATTSNIMEEALRAISDELTRCKELLQGQLPSQVIPNLRTDFRYV